MNNELKQKLTEGIVTVTFTKVDGNERIMPCTLNVDLIPSDYLPKSVEYHRSEDVCAVWATDVNGWRSFRWDSVKSFQ